MGLAIRRREDPAKGGAATGPGPDDALTTIAKVVPADALAAYVALISIAPGAHEDLWLFGFFVVGIVLALLSLWVSAKRESEKAPRWQWYLRVAAFITYTLVISHPLSAFVEVDSRLPRAALIVLTMVAGAAGYLNGKNEKK